MKTLPSLQTAAPTLAALFLAIPLPRAKAVDLGGYTGPVTIKLTLYASVTAYSLPPLNFAAGFGAGGSAPSVAGGIAALDALTQIPPVLAVSGEDFWGVAAVNSILNGSGATIWSPVTSQITAIYYFGKDYYLNQNAGALTTNGVGLHIDFYEQFLSDPFFTPANLTAGPAARTTALNYPTVTHGRLILSAVSTPGFINTPGLLGGAVAEVESVFTGGSGSVKAALNITGGQDAAQFDTNAIASTASGTNGVANADLGMILAIDTTGPLFGWTVKDTTDPITGLVTNVPEPSAVSLSALGILALAAKRARRRTVGQAAAR